MGKPIVVIDAPSNLGLRPGVERAPRVLREFGLVQKLNASYEGEVESPPYRKIKNKKTQIKNGEEVYDYSIKLADEVESYLRGGKFPIVLGGDCSIALGAGVALNRIGKSPGLFYIDGHADFYLPGQSSTGEIADMTLAILTGRGDENLTNIEERRPYFKDENVFAFGYRDSIEARRDGCEEFAKTKINSYPYTVNPSKDIRMTEIMKTIEKKNIGSLWVHLDVDVLSDFVMPAVDYRQPGGINYDSVVLLLRQLLTIEDVAGMDVTIYNPDLDNERIYATELVDNLGKAFRYYVNREV